MKIISRKAPYDASGNQAVFTRQNDKIGDLYWVCMDDRCFICLYENFREQRRAQWFEKEGSSELEICLK